MDGLFVFSSAARNDPEVVRWLEEQPGEVGSIARHWFRVLRECGDDVRELMHDGNATACVGDVAFAYVGAFTAHAAVGFYRGAELADPDEMLEGAGRFMRHVKLRPGAELDEAALTRLIGSAYADMKARIPE